MYIYIYTHSLYMYIHTHTLTYTHACTHIYNTYTITIRKQNVPTRRNKHTHEYHTCTHGYCSHMMNFTRVCVCVCICIYIHLYVYKHIYIYIYIYICIYIYIRLCEYLCQHCNTCVHTQIQFQQVKIPQNVSLLLNLLYTMNIELTCKYIFQILTMLFSSAFVLLFSRKCCLPG